VCCGKPMELLSENSMDASREKHIPVLEKEGNTLLSLKTEKEPSFARAYCNLHRLWKS